MPADLEQSLLAEARRLAEAGMAVFPLATGSKAPTPGSRGLLDATKDPAAVAAMWAATPAANIGINCGESRLVVVDVDGAKGGFASLGFWGEEHGPLPETVEALTQGEGAHLYFRAPNGIAVRTRAGLVPGIDIRAEGGYVVAPPSVGPSGGAYTWRAGQSPFEREFASLPDWLLALIQGPVASGPVAAGTADGVPEGQRNTYLTKEAGRLRALGCGEERILSGLVARNQSDCREPLPYEEVARIAASVAAYPAGAALPASGVPVLSLADLREQPALEWLVDGVIPDGGLAVLYGRPGSGKSFAALSLAYHVATGLEWLSRPVRGGDVVYLAAEGLRGLRARVEALSGFHGGNAERLFVVAQPVRFMRHEEVESLAETIAAREIRPRLVIIDTLARTMPGGDENTQRDVSQWVAGVDLLRQRFGCAVLVLHHSLKDGSGYRGSSALEGAADTMLEWGSSGFRCEKQKDAESGWTLEAGLQPFGESLVLVPHAGRGKGLPGQQERALEALRGLSAGGVWVRRADWEREAGIPSATFTKSVASLLAAGLVEEGPVDGGSRTFRLSLTR